MTTYREVKDKQLAILVELKAINAKLKELRPIVAVKPKVIAAHEVFKIEKEKQANTLKELKVLNAQLAELRGTRTAKVKDTSAVKAARDAAKALKAEAKAEKQAAKTQAKVVAQAEKEAKRAARRAQIEADRERRAEELEEQGRSASGYNIPLLTDKEREAATLMNKIFSELNKGNADLHEQRRQAHVAKLLEN